MERCLCKTGKVKTMSKRIALISAAVLMMAACTQMENPLQEERTPVTLQYASVLEAAETRASQTLNEGTLASGETVKVLIRNTGESRFESYDFITSDSGAMSPAGAVPYYPAGSQNIDIKAYYPASAGASFSVQADQTTDAAYKASDLMWAGLSNQAKQPQAVWLYFYHMMAKINVSVAAGSGISTISSVRILNVKPTVSFNQATGTVGAAGGTATHITMSGNGAAVIPAQTLSGNLLSIVTDKGTAIYSIAGEKEFIAGRSYYIYITVSLLNVGNTNCLPEWPHQASTLLVSNNIPDTIAGHECVDMGEGILWATTNLGASAAHKKGDYYYWAATETGETVPYYSSGNYTKYNIYDGRTSFAEFGHFDDAARKSWGNIWRIPTADEWAALLNTDNYSWEWVSDSQRKGMLVTRLRAPCAGNSIFLPAAGRQYGDGFPDEDVKGFYWCSTRPTSDNYTQDVFATALLFSDQNTRQLLGYTRQSQLSIRPVVSLNEF